MCVTLNAWKKTIESYIEVQENNQAFGIAMAVPFSLKLSFFFIKRRIVWLLLAIHIKRVKLSKKYHS